jgi:hypothetical protein
MIFARALVGLSLALAVSAVACSSSDSGSDTGDDADLTGAGGSGPALFRSDFYTYLKKDGHFTDEQIKQLVLMPTDAAITPHVAPNADDPLKPYDDAFKAMTPTDFYRKGLVEPLHFKVGPTGSLETELHRNPVHIVIVPGIFGEFIPVSPFEEVFKFGGAASVHWNDAITAAENDPSMVDTAHDRQFSAAQVGDVTRSLRDLVRVGSIDDSDGTPLVTITYLRPELGSLETFGTLDENCDYYLSRLDKYFAIAGMPKHLYVMGYSRGTPTALNLVTRGVDANASWVTSLKGVITLAGVIYGSQLADTALAPGPQKNLLDTMTDFVANRLESCDGATPDLALMARNVGHWAAFTVREAFNAFALTNENAELTREGIETDAADLGRMVAFTRRILFGDPQRVFSGESDATAILGVLHMNAPSAEYCQNIERFKTTVTQVLKGVQTLTTQSRLEWFKSHTLPTNIRYFSITGTMGDATVEGAQPTLLVNDRVAYDTRSLDFRNLRTNYWDLFKASGNQLEDSQVSLARARFWPEIHAGLNPDQGPLKAYFMGTVGIHHWGLSFPRAFSTNDGLEANPFPRALFLKSIGTFVAQVESRGR